LREIHVWSEKLSRSLQSIMDTEIDHDYGLVEKFLTSQEDSST